MNRPPHILYCHCSQARVLPVEAQNAALTAMCASGQIFEAVPDLCALAFRHDPRLKQLVEGGPVRIAACHGRAVKWLFAAGGATLPPSGVELINLRALAPAQIQAALKVDSASEQMPGPREAERETGSWFVRIPLRNPAVEAAVPATLLAQWTSTLLEQGCQVSCTGHELRVQAGAAIPGADAQGLQFMPSLDGRDSERLVKLVEELRGSSQAPASDGWLPWFPVIDFERCTHCLQCLSFCLFDVFGAGADGKIRVQNGANCKTNCPACARVCPEAAILFPKHPAPAINGAQPDQESGSLEPLKVDISLLLGGDVYSALRARDEQARARFSQERDPALALEERRKCLARLGRDIPPELLMALPSLEQIQRRAQQARKAQGADRRTDLPQDQGT